MLAYAALSVIGVGLLLVLVGTALAVSDHRRRSAPGPGGGAQPHAAADWLLKLLEALKDYDLGRWLVAMGVFLIILGGIMGGAAGLSS